MPATDGAGVPLITGGRLAGTCQVLRDSGSPLCRWARKLKLASIAWMMAMKYHGAHTALATSA